MENEKWLKVTNILSQDLTKDDFEMFIKPITPISFTENELIINVKNAFLRDKIIERFKKKIEKAIKSVFNIEVYIDFKLDNKDFVSEPVNIKSKIIKNKIFDALDEKFTFSRFVPGPSNELAYAAAKRICISPGEQYNPFFYYGPTGLGKTHLLQAIGQEALAKNSDIKVIYVTSQSFLDEFVNSIQKQTMPQFRNKYKKADIFLLDDVQFFEGKEQIQNELFYTFNLLFQDKKQMVFTSDRSMKELKGIQERLVARFTQGLSADIKPPSYEERKAIINQKIKDGKIKIDMDVVNFIAENITSNVRAIEGAINKIRLIQELKNKIITMDEAKANLEDMLDVVKKIISPHEIVKAVADYYGIGVSDLKGKTRKKDIAKPRQMAIYLMRELTNLSLTQIGLEFGGRDHSTVYHSCTTIEQDIKENISTSNDFSILYNKLIK